MGILCYLLIFWMFMYIYREYLSPKRVKARRKLKYLRNHFRDRINYDRDILEEEKLAVLRDYHGQAEEMLKSDAGLEDTEKLLKVAEKKYARVYPKKKSSVVKETTELLVVVFGVVMGLRALFFQPFKIPTGSMQPTLYGIHFVKMEKVPSSTVKRFFDYLNYGATYVDVKIKKEGYPRDGRIEDISFRFGPVTLINKTRLHIGESYYDINVDQKNLVKHVLPNALNKEGEPYATGDVFARGALYTGDYIMVDRMSYRFRDPRRGDIIVFITEGLGPDKKGLNGRHYIKRLVGLPGDTLRIMGRKLEVKEKGASDFVVVDGKFSKSFDRIYSGKGGYHGYTTSSRHLKMPFEGDTLKLGKDEYFAMGDNSRNSYDGRGWGILPRKNIIGRACFIWWPFSRRWGRSDTAEPVDTPTPPEWFPPILKAPTPNQEFEENGEATHE